MDEEIQILIKAVDEISGTLDSINSKLTEVGETAEKQSDNMVSSFQQQTNALLAVGNVAQSVDSIISSYINTELRLENAHTRVLNAEDRLSDAQKNLQHLQESGTATAYDLGKAQDEVDRATRSLTISENNLQRQKEMLTGTVISMELQIVNLAVSIPKAVAGIMAMTEAETIMEAITNPWVIAIGLATAAVSVMAVKSIESAAGLDNLSSSYNGTSTSSSNFSGVTDSTTLAIEIQRQRLEALNNQMDYFNQNSAPKTSETMKLWAQMMEGLNITVTQIEHVFEGWGKIINAVFKLLHINFSILASDQEDTVSFGPSVTSTVNDNKNAFLDWAHAVDGVSNSLDTVNSKTGGSTTKGTVTITTPMYGNNGQVIMPKQGTKVGDAIIRPNGQVIQTDPRDTLIAMKNYPIDKSVSNSTGQGIVINVTGNNLYGTDPDDIAKAIFLKLRRKILI